MTALLYNINNACCGFIPNVTR